ncbi:MAG: hypothetical protein ACRAVC_03740 [Trichormus sp.]
MTQIQKFGKNDQYVRNSLIFTCIALAAILCFSVAAGKPIIIEYGDIKVQINQTIPNPSPTIDIEKRKFLDTQDVPRTDN